MKSFDDLEQAEILALAISSEEEDGRIYADFAEGLREHHPDTAHVFSDMAAEENEHRRMLIDLYVSKFGSHIPLIRRQDVRGFVQRKRLWQVRLQGIDGEEQRAARALDPVGDLDVVDVDEHLRSGHGDGGFSNVAWIEVYGTAIPRAAQPTH